MPNIPKTKAISVEVVIFSFKLHAAIKAINKGDEQIATSDVTAIPALLTALSK